MHRVRVDGFWIDRTRVTNRQFVKATGHFTVAEIAPDPNDSPGALPHMLRAGSLEPLKVYRGEGASYPSSFSEADREEIAQDFVDRPERRWSPDIRS